MSLMFEPLRKYATFSGRARRKEYWLFWLFTNGIVLSLLVLLLFSVAGAAANAEQAGRMLASGGVAAMAVFALALVYLLLFIPSLAVTVRRLHDSDNSGWWLLLTLLPGGTFVIFIFALIDGTAGPNRHGPDPKGREAIRFPA